MAVTEYTLRSVSRKNPNGPFMVECEGLPGFLMVPANHADKKDFGKLVGVENIIGYKIREEGGEAVRKSYHLVRE